MGHVSLQNVTFSYGGPVPVLRNVSLTFEPGTVTAIMGPSGAGKSTIVRLIAGMSVPSAGQVFFDGMPLSQLAIRDVRRQLGTVWQEPVLFRGTLWENLVVDGVSLTRDRVQEVVRACRLEEVLDGLAQGYETIVGESGMTLSGGQRQRVAIARALLRDAPILLLDEPTSQLDARTEEEVIAGLLAAVNNRTIIFVTHRPAAAALADRVCLLDAGRIVALGSHAELARTCSAYQESLNVEAERNAPDRRVRVMNS
jgi:ABC-type multidrug transport system fused ATPase/permease subunit